VAKFFKYQDMTLIKSCIISFIYLLFGIPLYFISGFVPRNNKVWVFGSGNIYNDNGRYFYEFIRINNREIRAIWISKNKKSVLAAKNKGGEAYLSWSLKGFYYSLIAKVYIFSSGLKNINAFTSKNAFKVNLGYGVGLKKIGFDISLKKYRLGFFIFINRMITPSSFYKPDLLLCPSNFFAKHVFISAFEITSKNIIIGTYPRTLDLVSRNSMHEKTKDKFIFLYAPTWRDNGENFIKKSSINFNKLNEFLAKNNALFFIKLHHLTKIDHKTRYKNILFVDRQSDSNKWLKMADCLITDYSSIYFDYLYLSKPILFFNFDYDDYINNRELYFDDKDYTPGEKCSTFPILLDAMQRILNGEDTFKENRGSMLDILYFNEKSNHNLLKEIKKRIK